MKLSQIFLLIMLNITLASSEAMSCPGQSHHQMTLLSKLYPPVLDSPIIAEVEISGIKKSWEDGSYDQKYEKIIAAARVIKSIKGGDLGQSIKIDATPSSCLGGLYEKDIGRRGFIAGQILDGVFHSGRWFPAKFGIDTSVE